MTSSGVNKPGLIELAELFFRIGNTTFGSGATTIVLISEEMNRREWLPRWRTDLLFTLARVVPGTNLLAFVASTGHVLQGWRGATAALLALSVPASCGMLLLTLGYQHWNGTRFGDAFITAAMSAIVGVIVGGGWLLAYPRFQRSSRLRTILMVVGAALLSRYLSPLVILLLAGVTGYFWPERGPGSQ
ncbi:MAG: chromate transporter [Bryobacteraceae bacterium]|nr:chromate transporter [Bryobacteraceae bacterium]